MKSRFPQALRLWAGDALAGTRAFGSWLPKALSLALGAARGAPVELTAICSKNFKEGQTRAANDPAEIAAMVFFMAALVPWFSFSAFFPSLDAAALSILFAPDLPKKTAWINQALLWLSLMPFALFGPFILGNWLGVLARARKHLKSGTTLFPPKNWVVESAFLSSLFHSFFCFFFYRVTTILSGDLPHFLFSAVWIVFLTSITYFSFALNIILGSLSLARTFARIFLFLSARAKARVESHILSADGAQEEALRLEEALTGAPLSQSLPKRL